MSGWLGLAAEIRDVIGDASALTLLRARGGTEIVIPQTAAGSQLARIVGEADAAALIDHFGAGRLELPTGVARGIGATRRRAVEMLRDGASEREVALACNLHMRTVRRFRADIRDDRQMRLPFDRS